MKILILGAGGQLGALLSASAPAHLQVVAATSLEANICDAQQLAATLASVAPDVVINAAAYTQVDKAETEAELAFAVNQQGVRNIIEASSSATRIIHVSTDFVFDGTATIPYLPNARVFDGTAAIPDLPHASINPLSVYGRSKLAGEQELLEHAAQRSCIVRTAWLYAASGKNFMNTMLALMASRAELSVVNDQIGTPTSAHGLAEALWRFVERPQLHGVFHWTDAGEASWYDFACEIQRLGLAYGLLHKAIPISPIPTTAYPTPAHRPAYSVLDKHTTWTALQTSGIPWAQALDEVMKIKVAQQEKSQR